jgi:hypothetical protein
LSRGQALDLELRRLVVGTNEQRRRVGQALYHYWRTLAFWHAQGRPFAAITLGWCGAGASIFTAMAATLGDLGEPREDGPLRRYLAEVLGRLADDLARGDAMLVPFLRWLEARFPSLTALMRREAESSPIHDLALAVDLADLFRSCGGCGPADLPVRFREGSVYLVGGPATP